jgi:hypothetical protein
MNWSETWTLGFHATGAKAITGPALYGEQTVEVVPKLEAEQRLDRAEDKGAAAERQKARNALALAEQANENEMRVEQANTDLRRELAAAERRLVNTRCPVHGESAAAFFARIDSAKLAVGGTGYLDWLLHEGDR